MKCVVRLGTLPFASAAALNLPIYCTNSNNAQICALNLVDLYRCYLVYIINFSSGDANRDWLRTSQKRKNNGHSLVDFLIPPSNLFEIPDDPCAQTTGCKSTRLLQASRGTPCTCCVRAHISMSIDLFSCVVVCVCFVMCGGREGGALQSAHIYVFWNILEKIRQFEEIRRKRAALHTHKMEGR